jgi:hypothetical protein
LPIAQWSLGTIDGYPVFVADALFIVLAVLCGWAIVTRRTTIVWSPWHAAIAAFAAIGLLSAAVSNDPDVSLMRGAGNGFLGALAVLGAHYGRDERLQKSILFAWIAGTVATVGAAAIGLVLFAAGDSANRFLYGFGSLPAGSYPRVQGLFVNANMLCTYLAAAVFMVMAGARAQLIERRVAVPLTAAILIVAAFTLSPGLGGIALGLSLWWSAQTTGAVARRIGYAGAGVALLFVVAILGSPTMLQGESAGVDFEPSSRVLAWRDAARTFVEPRWRTSTTSTRRTATSS